MLPGCLLGSLVYPKFVMIDLTFGSLGSGGSGGKYDVQVRFSWLFLPA
jgi:hypothetical protein